VGDLLRGSGILLLVRSYIIFSSYLVSQSDILYFPCDTILTLQLKIGY
jgi:hypothetical protein